MKKLENWQKSFFTIYIGQAFSLLSSSAVQFSIIWWITVQTGSALALTIASVVGLLPQAVIGPFAGVWIDRYNRKTIMIIADIIVATSSLVLFIAFFWGIPSIIFVYVVLFTRSLGEIFHRPAMQAAIPQLVPKNELTKAGGLGQMVQSACSMMGPMLGALLMSIATLQYVMLVDIIGATLAIITLSLVKISKHRVNLGSKLNVINDMKEGIKAIKSNEALMRISIPILISTIIFVPLGTLLPLMVKNYFNGTALHNGIIQALFASGMLISAMVIGVTGGMKKQFLMISLGILFLGICSLIGGFLPASGFWIFCIVVFIMGTTGMISNIPYTAYIQKTIPQENLGKVISLVTSVMSFAAPVGMFIAGPVTEVIGISHWMIYAGILMLFVGVLSYLLTRKFDYTVQWEDSIYE
ncbi:MFS transporter [Alkaliphilus hydrothermalis]|uniref:DHA3 family macrolide efflux protein-like MFS transporter n=1 Tax=Alkaliphilus hydrothermalis TaxID=1482730 RepID=A0ABS2NNH1_9FIRM|nr:MFS transporter [Alkaliphilus hydrothermalis]MBM7614495.1 DHA3 family macrolide efflux protein-like MFS transporter [Alkaliphilus hydrothermalis]